MSYMNCPHRYMLTVHLCIVL